MNVNEFIKKLQAISADKRKLPIRIVCPNGLQVEPKIKMLKKDGDLWGEVEKMIITY